ncbi:hypothetical protein PC110_g19309 [Phytophthora cactorum]|uniref:MULE transposase domain-containing protein n=2 Tax=Phytophthora cactorum TaxID=29920 RepID=A0A329RIT1_9STRA|nr:hypothetical protein PC110_g19309 [Phytophthora cactorum]
MPPGMVWELVMASLREAYPEETLSTIPRLPSITIIKYTRTQATGSDAFRAIESIPTRNVAADDSRPFLQFSVVHTVGCGQQRYLGFGHPELVRLLRYAGSAIFIDGIFKMVPRPFPQCLIVMMRDPGMDMYVPATYVLMDSKQQDAYWNALNYVIVQTDRLLEPATVTCDFEHGLMNAITEQFPLVKIRGCLFHWKRALRRKMVELCIARPQISAVLRSGVIDVLAIIPIDQIADKGFRFVRAQMDETGNKTKWDAFWRYFRKTWVTSYDAGLWNVNSMTESGIDLQNRTTTR